MGVTWGRAPCDAEASAASAQPAEQASAEKAPECGKEMSGLAGKDMDMDAVGRQFEPNLTAGCVFMLVAPSSLWCDLGCCPQTVVVIKFTVRTRLFVLL